MLDMAEYRLSESAAKGQVKNWRISQTHHVDHFEKAGFPVRPAYFFEIGQLLDTMQENRFEDFVKELGGLSSEDETLLLTALNDCIDFQLINFPRRKPVAPISTMISNLALYKKLINSQSGPLRILEVGPGCGYLPFFLAGNPRVAEYTQVEAAESFYLLQNRVNAYCYKSMFVDFAHQFEKFDYSFTSRNDFEADTMIDENDKRPVRSNHFPWWMLGILHSRQSHYNIVSSNANLNEFSNPALRDYLKIFHNVLDPKGLFIVQCTGFTAHGTLEGLYDELHSHGFAPVISTIAGDVPKGSKAHSLLSKDREKYFALNNLIMVKEGHELFDKCNSRANFANGSAIDADFLAGMYGLNQNGSQHTKKSFLERLNEGLQVGLSVQGLSS